MSHSEVSKHESEIQTALNAQCQTVSLLPTHGSK